jgi:anti-sigma B factor antagonist
MDRTTERPDATILHLDGDLDLNTVPALENSLRDAVRSGRHVIVDLNGVTYIDASGYRSFEDCQRRLNERGFVLLLASPAPRIRRLIDLLHLNTVIPTCATVEDAMDALGDTSLAALGMRNTLVPVTFRFARSSAPRARRVTVTGSFNGWDREAHPLARRTGGDWDLTIYLPPGRVVYCFSVDGAPWLDPDDDERMPNGWGSEYSVRYVRPPDPPAPPEMCARPA